MNPGASLLHSGKPGARLLLIGLLLVMLMIPASMIRSVVSEREQRRDEAVLDIVAKWGGRQTLAGPILRVPFVKRLHSKNAKGEDVGTTEAGIAYLLPRSLAVDVAMTSELRHRGIFEVPVYGAKLHLSGRFERPDFAVWGALPADIDWPHAELLINLSEPRTLQAESKLLWDGHAIGLQPSTGRQGSWAGVGIHAALGQSLNEIFVGNSGAAFELDLALNGAESLYFAPTAEDTQVSLRTNWPHPSFQGNWLPQKYEVSDDGATAQWSVSYLGRNYPQAWRESEAVEKALGEAVFGLELATPVDLYVLADRVTKYALLVLVFTFAVIWLTEVLSARRVHPVQYAFIGAALCLFGLLQLTFAEHFGFTLAFMVAAAAVVSLVTLYSHGVLKSAGRAAVVGGVLSLLYGCLYVILRAEDYALLGGSLALFAGIAAAMFLTRKVDWFALGTPTPPPAVS